MLLHHHHERDASIQYVLLKKMKCCGLLMEAYLGKIPKYKLGRIDIKNKICMVNFNRASLQLRLSIIIVKYSVWLV